MTKLSELTGGSGVTTFTSVNDLPLTHSAGDMAFVDSSDRLYVSNGEGWYSLSLINNTPSFTTSPNASYELDSNGGTATTLNLAANDSDDNPLFWTYIPADSASAFVTITNDSNGTFTITSKTLADWISAGYDSSGGSFDITFKVSDGISFANAASTFTTHSTLPEAYYNFNVYGVTGSTTGTAYQIDGVNTSYSGGSTISTTSLSLDTTRTIQHQYLAQNAGVTLGAVDMTSSDSKDFTWQFFIKTSNSTSYHNVFNGNGAFNSEVFKYGPASEGGNWYWYEGQSYNPPSGTTHQGANTWYHMIIQGDYSAGTVHTWIDTTYIGSSSVGQGFWDTAGLADFSGLTINYNSSNGETHNMYIGEMKIWKGYQYYTTGSDTTWAKVFS